MLTLTILDNGAQWLAYASGQEIIGGALEVFEGNEVTVVG